jgi:toxin ParE1/3/4
LAIAKYIARDSPAAAADWLDEIVKTLRLLSNFPEIGEKINYSQRNLRRFSQGRYLIFYSPSGDGIDVVRVLHGSRDIDAQFSV